MFRALFVYRSRFSWRFSASCHASPAHDARLPFAACSKQARRAPSVSRPCCGPSALFATVQRFLSRFTCSRRAASLRRVLETGAKSAFGFSPLLRSIRAVRDGSALLSTCRPCREQRGRRERGAGACRPPGTRWSAGWRRWRPHSPARSGSP